jgi:hypothetical protein
MEMKSPFKQNISSFLNNKDTANKNSYFKFKDYHFDNNLNLQNNNQNNIKNNYPIQNYLNNNLGIIKETMSNYSSTQKSNNKNILEEIKSRYYQSNKKNFQRPIYHNYDEKLNFRMKKEFLSKKIFFFKF